MKLEHFAPAMEWWNNREEITIDGFDKEMCIRDRLCRVKIKSTYAGVVELADTQDLGSCAYRCAGSSPVTRTILSCLLYTSRCV